LPFRVTLPEIFTLSVSEYETLHQTWLKAIKMLPAGSVLHKQDWFTQDKYQANFNTGSDVFLQRSSERFFNERPYLSHRCYLMILYAVEISN
jgi:hypothetical protein